MKKRIRLFVCLALILSLTGCGKSNGTSDKTGNQPASVNDVLQQGMSEMNSEKINTPSLPAENDAMNDQQSGDSPAAPEPVSTPDTASKPKVSSDGIDVDLTALSSTMVYSEVFNMMTSPEKYIGKTVKMEGPFAFYHDESSDNYYFACIIQDATACCSQGLEFVLKGEHKYPDDYPEVGTEICVTGTFDTYQEGDATYCTLRNADLL